jgi:predicted AAA+ superfamily ATPase
MFERSEKQLLTNRLETEPRRFIQVLYGPRQVGKTTLVTQFYRQTRLPVHFVSADAVALSQAEWLEAQWNAARLKAKSSEAVLIVDEIQKIGNWSEVVKKEWDHDTREGIQLKVVILGSSRLMLQQGLTESLAGRFETTYLGHWSFSEMSDAFGFSPEEFVWFGGYPGAAPLAADEDRWKKYVADALIDATISKDIMMLTRVDKPSLMRRLFELGCTYSGQVLSFTKILGQLQDAGNTTTLSHYLHLLDTAGLLGGIERYSPDVIRQRASSPKFQVHNTALMTAQQVLTFAEIRQQPDKWGRWVESAVGAHLLNSSLRGEFSLYYWRFRNAEVDFVLERKGQAVGIEVKSGTGRATSGMEAFRKQHNPWKMYMVGSAGISLENFLKMDPVDLF